MNSVFLLLAFQLSLVKLELVPDDLHFGREFVVGDIIPATNLIHECNESEYYSTNLNKSLLIAGCVPCSECPSRSIIVQQCTHYSDTVCLQLPTCDIGQYAKIESEISCSTDAISTHYFSTCESLVVSKCIDCPLPLCSEDQYLFSESPHLNTKEELRCSKVQCRNCSICRDDEDLISACKPDTDTVCGPRSSCLMENHFIGTTWELTCPDSFLESCPSLTSDNECNATDVEQWSSLCNMSSPCKAQEHCYVTETKACQPCTSCMDYENEIKPCTSTSDRICASCPTCVPGQYCSIDLVIDCNTDNSTSGYDPVTCNSYKVPKCRECNEFTVNYSSCSRLCLNCEAGKFMSSNCTLSSETKCDPCSTCTQGKYRQSNCTPLSDTVCAPCSTCTEGSYLKSACLPSVDAICAPCSTCIEGSYQKSTCSTSADTVCAICDTCASDSFLKSACSAAGNTVCQLCKTCSANEVIVDKCGQSSDGTCEPAVEVVISFRTTLPMSSAEFQQKAKGYILAVGEVVFARLLPRDYAGFTIDQRSQFFLGKVRIVSVLDVSARRQLLAPSVQVATEARVVGKANAAAAAAGLNLQALNAKLAQYGLPAATGLTSPIFSDGLASSVSNVTVTPSVTNVIMAISSVTSSSERNLALGLGLGLGLGIPLLLLVGFIFYRASLSNKGESLRSAFLNQEARRSEVSADLAATSVILEVERPSLHNAPTIASVSERVTTVAAPALLQPSASSVVESSSEAIGTSAAAMRDALMAAQQSVEEHILESNSLPVQQPRYPSPLGDHAAAPAGAPPEIVPQRTRRHGGAADSERQGPLRDAALDSGVAELNTARSRRPIWRAVEVPPLKAKKQSDFSVSKPADGFQMISHEAVDARSSTISPNGSGAARTIGSGQGGRPEVDEGVERPRASSLSYAGLGSMKAANEDGQHLKTASSSSTVWPGYGRRETGPLEQQPVIASSRPSVVWDDQSDMGTSLQQPFFAGSRFHIGPSGQMGTGLVGLNMRTACVTSYIRPIGRSVAGQIGQGTLNDDSPAGQVGQLPRSQTPYSDFWPDDHEVLGQVEQVQHTAGTLPDGRVDVGQVGQRLRMDSPCYFVSDTLPVSIQVGGQPQAATTARQLALIDRSEASQCSQLLRTASSQLTVWSDGRSVTSQVWQEQRSDSPSFLEPVSLSASVQVGQQLWTANPSSIRPVDQSQQITEDPRSLVDHDGQRKRTGTPSFFEFDGWPFAVQVGQQPQPASSFSYGGPMGRSEATPIRQPPIRAPSIFNRDDRAGSFQGGEHLRSASPQQSEMRFGQPETSQVWQQPRPGSPSYIETINQQWSPQIRQEPLTSSPQFILSDGRTRADQIWQRPRTDSHTYFELDGWPFSVQVGQQPRPANSFSYVGPIGQSGASRIWQRPRTASPQPLMSQEGRLEANQGGRRPRTVSPSYVDHGGWPFSTQVGQQQPRPANSFSYCGPMGRLEALTIGQQPITGSPSYVAQDGWSFPGGEHLPSVSPFSSNRHLSWSVASRVWQRPRTASPHPRASPDGWAETGQDWQRPRTVSPSYAEQHGWRGTVPARQQPHFASSHSSPYSHIHQIDRLEASQILHRPGNASQQAHKFPNAWTESGLVRRRQWMVSPSHIGQQPLPVSYGWPGSTQVEQQPRMSSPHSFISHFDRLEASQVWQQPRNESPLPYFLQDGQSVESQDRLRPRMGSLTFMDADNSHIPRPSALFYHV